MRERPLDAAELVRRLVKRPGGVQDSQRDAQGRPWAGSVSATIGIAASGGGGGGGGGGAGQHGELSQITPSVVGAYPYWDDNFNDNAITGWTVRKGTWAEAGGILKLTAGAGLGTFRGFITYDDSAGLTDIESFVTLAGLNIDNYIIGARLNTASTPTGYGVRYKSGTVYIRRLTGTGSVGLSSVAHAMVQGDQLGIRCHGTKIQAVVNGTTILEATDGTHTSGLIGLIGQSTALPEWDDWGTR